MPDRIKRFTVSSEIFLILGSNKFEVVDNPLPKDAEITNVYIDQNGRDVVFVIRSESFEPILWGDYIPFLKSPVLRKLE